MHENKRFIDKNNPRSIIDDIFSLNQQDFVSLSVIYILINLISASYITR